MLPYILDALHKLTAKSYPDPKLPESYIPRPITLILPNVRSIFTAVLHEAEEIKGEPVNSAEFAAVAYQSSAFCKILTPIEIIATLQIIFMEDLFYTNNDFQFFTMRGAHLKGFELFSEKFQRLYASKGYILDKEMRVRASSTCKTVNLRQLMDMLASKDEKQYQNMQWVFDGHDRFLDGTPRVGNKVAFCSFPRSGNSFLRKYLEKLTGITTGSDNDIRANICLMMAGLKGEYIVDDTTWIVKSHHPWNMLNAMKPSNCNKVIQIVRNPIDVIPSFNALNTYLCHSQKLPFDIEKEYPEKWQQLVDKFSVDMQKFYDTNIDLGLNYKQKAPVLWIRYEDLVMDPENCLRQIARFLLNKDDITGTNIERRVNDVSKKSDREQLQSYKLKSSTLQFNSQAKMYNQSQKEQMRDSLVRMLYYFGYMKHPTSRDEDKTAFYEYPESHKHDPKLLDTFCQYRKDNEETIQFLSKHTEEQIHSLFDYHLMTNAIDNVECNSSDLNKEYVKPVAIDYYTKQLYPHKF